MGDRVWRKPLTEFMTRSFSTPAVRSSPNDGEASGDALDQLLDIQLVQAAPGKIRARCVVQPRDRVHMKVADIRLKQLTDPQVSSKQVTSALAKSMRKNGGMMPK